MTHKQNLQNYPRPNHNKSLIFIMHKMNLVNDSSSLVFSKFKAKSILLHPVNSKHPSIVLEKKWSFISKN